MAAVTEVLMMTCWCFTDCLLRLSPKLFSLCHHHLNHHPPPHQEEYLSEEEFEAVFGMDKEDFRAMPPWKRINAKKAKGLF
jgi:hypothetical protein